MILSKRLVEKYQKEYKRKFGRNISPKDAERELIDLKDLARLLARVRRRCDGR